MRIFRNKVNVAAALFIGLAALVSVTLTYRFLFVLPMGLSHSAYLAPDTALRISFQPARVQHHISRLAPTATRFVRGVPRLTSMQSGPIRLDWIHTLPLEFTILSAQRMSGIQSVVLFVRETPKGRDFAGVLNGSGFFQDLRVVDWTPAQVHPDRQGFLLAQGTLPIPETTQEIVAQRWPDIAPLSPPPLSGNHVFEASADNANGVLQELHGALVQTYGPWESPELNTMWSNAWPAIHRVYLSADWIGKDEATIVVDIEIALLDQMPLVQAALQGLADALSARAGEREGTELSGEQHTTESGHLRGEYRLRGFERSLGSLLGKDSSA